MGLFGKNNVHLSRIEVPQITSKNTGVNLRRARISADNVIYLWGGDLKRQPTIVACPDYNTAQQIANDWIFPKVLS